MSKLVEIPITKGLLLLCEHKLRKTLPPELCVEGLKRGKAMKQRRGFQNYAQKMTGG